MIRTHVVASKERKKENVKRKREEGSHDGASKNTDARQCEKEEYKKD